MWWENINLNSVRVWWQIQSVLIVWWLGKYVAITFNSNWNDFGLFLVVSAAVESSINFFRHVLSSTTNWPWINVIWISTALSDFLRDWLSAIRHWHAEFFLFWSQYHWCLWNNAVSCAVLDVGAVQSSGATDWDNDWCGIVLNWSDFWWLRLVRSLRDWALWGRWRNDTRWLCSWRLSWTWWCISWWTRGICWRSLGNWAGWSWSNKCRVIIGWCWVELWVAWQVLIAWLSYNVSFLCQDLWGWLSSSDRIVLVKWNISSLRETTADFRCIATTRLWIAKNLYEFKCWWMSDWSA